MRVTLPMKAVLEIVITSGSWHPLHTFLYLSISLYLDSTYLSQAAGCWKRA